MKVKVETSTQVFIDGQPEPVRIADFSIDTSWEEKYMKNHIASICYGVIKELQNDVVNLKRNEAMEAELEEK